MDALNFAYWLRGYFEINGETALTKEQVEIISRHLALVFQEKAKQGKPLSKMTEKDWEEALKSIAPGLDKFKEFGDIQYCSDWTAPKGLSGVKLC